MRMAHAPRSESMYRLADVRILAVMSASDGELESLRFVHGHQADAVAALFENRRLARLAVFGLLAQLLDKSAERNPAIRSVTACELGDVKHIRQHLLVAMLEGEVDLGAGGVEESCRPSQGSQLRRNRPSAILRVARNPACALLLMRMKHLLRANCRRQGRAHEEKTLYPGRRPDSR